MFELLVAIASIVLIAVSQLLFKGAMLRLKQSDRKRGLIGVVTHPWIIGGLALNGFAAVCWILALRKLEISYLFPLLSINYLIVPLGAWWLFNERVSRTRKLAIAVICVGVSLCLFSKPETSESAEQNAVADSQYGRAEK